MRGVATLQEIDNHYSLTDLWLANQALDVQDDADTPEHPHA